MPATITLITGGSLTHFADLATTYSASLRRVYLISPWITCDPKTDFVPFSQTLACVERSRARLSVLTRTPDRPGHLEALRRLRLIKGVDLFVLEALHAKLYLLECNGFRGAVIGSANFTKEGDREYLELAVDLRATRPSDQVGRFVDSLFEFARELLAEPRSKYWNGEYRETIAAPQRQPEGIA